ncbi:MAG: hypothetical protein Q8K75_06470 [Chlamydiales bacterium]|nr:hypothetical protein [Chlamydiales bacterium]
MVTYESCQLVQILEARRLVVPEIQEALIVIGSGQNARIKAKNGPFTIENLGLMVGFNPDGNHPPKPYISLISLLNGNILYKVRNDNNSGFELLHEESFEDALRIVEEESQHHNTTSEC